MGRCTGWCFLVAIAWVGLCGVCQSFLGGICWVRFPGLCSLVHVYWVRFARSDFLSQLCWLRFAWLEFTGFGVGVWGGGLRSVVPGVCWLEFTELVCWIQFIQLSAYWALLTC